MYVPLWAVKQKLQSGRNLPCWLELKQNGVNSCGFTSRFIYIVDRFVAPSPPIDIWAMMVVWRGNYQNCSVLYCVLKLYTVISTIRCMSSSYSALVWVLSHTHTHTHRVHFVVRRLIYLCLSVCILCVFVSYCIVVLLWSWWGGSMKVKPNPWIYLPLVL